MDTLVLLRRALKIISEEGYPLRVKDFAQKLSESYPTLTSRLVRHRR